MPRGLIITSCYHIDPLDSIIACLWDVGGPAVDAGTKIIPYPNYRGAGSDDNRSESLIVFTTKGGDDGMRWDAIP